MNTTWSEWLDPARERELQHLRRVWRHISYCFAHKVSYEVDWQRDPEQIRTSRQEYEADLEQLMQLAEFVKSPKWQPTRKRRRAPSPEAICAYWDRPKYCFRCKATGVTLERAHLVDRAKNGLDDVQNMVLLCRPCHRRMSSFGPEEAADAIVYANV